MDNISRYIDSAIVNTHIALGLKRAKDINMLDIESYSSGSSTIVGCDFRYVKNSKDYYSLMCEIHNKYNNTDIYINSDIELYKYMQERCGNKRVLLVDEDNFIFASKCDIFLSFDIATQVFLRAIGKTTMFLCGNISNRNFFESTRNAVPEQYHHYLAKQKGVNINTPFDLMKVFFGDTLPADVMERYANSMNISWDAFWELFELMLAYPGFRSQYGHIAMNSLQWEQRTHLRRVEQSAKNLLSQNTEPQFMEVIKV